jgi:hypothetical protein
MSVDQWYYHCAARRLLFLCRFGGAENNIAVLIYNRGSGNKGV